MEHSLEASSLIDLLLLLALAGAAGVLLSAVAVAWLAISDRAARNTSPWERSPIPEKVKSGVEQNITYALLQLDLFEQELSEMRERLSSGSSSGNVEACRTSTSSSPTESTRMLSLDGGMKSSEAANDPIFTPGRASSDSAKAETERSAMRESTQGSKSKSNCRLCSKMRDLVGGGVSRVAAKLWSRPQACQRVTSGVSKSPKHVEPAADTSKTAYAKAKRASSNRNGVKAGASPTKPRKKPSRLS